MYIFIYRANSAIAGVVSLFNLLSNQTVYFIQTTIGANPLPNNNGIKYAE